MQKKEKEKLKSKTSQLENATDTPQRIGVPESSALVLKGEGGQTLFRSVQ